MMDYEIFKKVVEEKFLDYLPEEYQNRKIVVSPVEKVNCSLDGLVVMDTKEGVHFSPTIYINYMYSDYQDTEDLEQVLKHWAHSFDEWSKQKLPFDVQALLSDECYVKEHVVFQFINAEENQELLMDMPHREYLDLAIVYRFIVDIGENGITSVMIRNTVATMFGLTETQLFQFAAENTRRMFPPVVKSMQTVIKDLLYNSGLDLDSEDVEILEDFLESIPQEEQLYVIGNPRNTNGAISILYEDVLYHLAQKVDSDLYIMPSSVHECIATSSKNGTVETFASMVESVNMSDVPLTDRLSNQVYYYDRNLRKTSLATDTTSKLLG